MNEIIPTSSVTLTSFEFLKRMTIRKDKKIFIYSWKNSKGDYLYIGKTTIGMKRFNGHDIIKNDLIEETDTFEFWYCYNQKHVDVLEKLLIFLLKPVYNTIDYIQCKELYPSQVDEYVTWLKNTVDRMERLNKHLLNQNPDKSNPLANL